MLSKLGTPSRFIPATGTSSPLPADTRSQRRQRWTSCAPWRINSTSWCGWGIGGSRQHSRIDNDEAAHQDGLCCRLQASLLRARGGNTRAASQGGFWGGGGWSHIGYRRCYADAVIEQSNGARGSMANEEHLTILGSEWARRL